MGYSKLAKYCTRLDSFLEQESVRIQPALEV